MLGTPPPRSDYSFRAGSFFEPRAPIFLLRLEACKPPETLLSPLPSEMGLQAFVGTLSLLHSFWAT